MGLHLRPYRVGLLPDGLLFLLLLLMLLADPALLAGRHPPVVLVEMGFHHIGQAGLELLTASDPLTSASQSAGITGMSPCALPRSPW
ncbi:PLA2G15 isoform 11 [Pan troglodytes]|uniref:PLA2G15 isoform 11 n=1 Tax=Pan troglodytes TaxID=9598 RepID=A0A2J8Q499_PANTR|nr:PLA2G15 isoform 11 [Pan troglodytes]